MLRKTTLAVAFFLLALAFGSQPSANAQENATRGN